MHEDFGIITAYAPSRQDEMTFTYGVISKGGIVLAADSQVTRTHRYRDTIVGTYVNNCKKIITVGNHCAFSISGNAGMVDGLLARTTAIDPEQPFEKIVKDFQAAFKHELNEKYDGIPPSCEVLFVFCGYALIDGKHVPEIIRLDIRDCFAWMPIANKGFAASGAVEHGAARYIQNRFYREDLNLEQAKLLAYCITREVADQDNSVSDPIDLVAITPDAVTSILDLRKYERARIKLASTISKFVKDFA